MRMGLTRIQDLVLNLRKFSRLDEGERTRVHVPEAIETVLALIQHKLGDRIAVVRDFTGRPEIHCTPALLNQVVMNILGNAADAMPGAAPSPSKPGAPRCRRHPHRGYGTGNPRGSA